MVTGRIRQKRKYYQMIVSSDVFGEKSISTSIKALSASDFELAKNMLDKVLLVFDETRVAESIAVIKRNVKNGTFLTASGIDIMKEISSYGKEDGYAISDTEDILFSKWMLEWVKTKKKQHTDSIKEKGKVRSNTYSNYLQQIETRIGPYFDKKGITLKRIKKEDIEAYYKYEIEELGNTANTVKRRHDLINPALKHAVKKRLIVFNPADDANLPVVEKKTPDYYLGDEMQEIQQIVKGTNIELAIIIAGYYGLRRSELLGLRWSAIDFRTKTIHINHTVIEYTDQESHKHIIKKADLTKNSSSNRYLPLEDIVEVLLLEERKKQLANKELFGNTYYDGDIDYVFVNPTGELYKPDYISREFKKVLKNANTPLEVFCLKAMRHSAATYMRDNDVYMEDISAILGHSSTQVTESIYANMTMKKKKLSLQPMNELYRKK